MNKTAIKNFAIWARNKLIADISYRAGLMGITVDGIQNALPQSTGTTEFYDIGTAEPYSISGDAVKQRKHLVELIQRKEKETNYKTAYKYVLEEVAYTWFNRLIAVRFMEVNDYLPAHIRVLSSDSGKMEPDLVTTPFEANLSFTRNEEQLIYQLKQENKLDEVFRILFIKQCNVLNEILPALFEKTSDYTELLLNLSVIDLDGVVYHLVNDIPEEDFDVEHGGQVEIIGWLYQYYNDEYKNQVININKSVIKKEDIPAATQLFTTDWVVRYLVDNTLGRYWIENSAGSNLRNHLDFYIDFPSSIGVNRQISPEKIKVLDPCVGSGHFLAYAFDVLMLIYKECGYSERDAAELIITKNLFGLDIDNRSAQLAYFSLMMKARQYNRRILNRNCDCHIYAIVETNGFDNHALDLLKDQKVIGEKLIHSFCDAKEYGSLLKIDITNEELTSLSNKITELVSSSSNNLFDVMYKAELESFLIPAINQARLLTDQYHIVVTNPPYLNRFDDKLKQFVTDNYKDYAGDLFSVFMMRNFEYCYADGYTGFMTPFVWMFIRAYEKLRTFIINNKDIISLIQMEYSAFEEATVPICAFVLGNDRRAREGIYIKLSDFKGGMEVQRKKSLDAIHQVKSSYTYKTDALKFQLIPRAPFAYWFGDKLYSCYEAGDLLKGKIDSQLGSTLGINDSFLRLWFEIDRSKKEKWYRCLKGGAFRRWSGNIDYVVNWEDSGKEVKATGKATIRGEATAFNEGISWSQVTSALPSFRYKPAGTFIESASGMCKIDERLSMYLLGYLNSSVATMILNALNPTIHIQTGDVERLPWILEEKRISLVHELVTRNIQLSDDDWNSFETSWDFDCHPLIKKGLSRSRRNVDNITIEECFGAWSDECETRFDQLKENEEELNRIFIDIYGLQDELTPEVDDKDVTVRRADLQRDIRSLLSYAIGCMFGRYSLGYSGLTYAGSEWEDGRYGLFKPDVDNIIPISDEEYLEDDIVSRLCAFLKVAFGEGALEENLDYIAKALGNKGNSSREVVRNYFLNDFFKDHCQTYSVTGSGKRPIYWLFDSGKQNGFKALIYLHRYNADTIGNLRIDYLHRMQRIYENEISRMQDMIDHSTSSREVAQATKRREKLTKQLKECREYDEKLAHLALSRIELDLDDGVKKNYRKIQTANDGKFYEVLADSKNIMAKE